MQASKTADQMPIEAQRTAPAEARVYLIVALQMLDKIHGRAHLAARCQELIDLIDAA